ncbi:MAG TPA: serine hydrolase, partial [Thermoanaerobaculia bacterium]|nr:serine hydrolase [Thermoanaerobaculia bacterium]
DRSELTANCGFYFSEQAVKDFAASLAPLGAPSSVTQQSTSERGGMRFRLFEVKFPSKTLAIWERDMPDGKIEQFEVMGSDS